VTGARLREAKGRVSGAGMVEACVKSFLSGLSGLSGLDHQASAPECQSNPYDPDENTAVCKQRCRAAEGENHLFAARGEEE
jgi:hypothetical protein